MKEKCKNANAYKARRKPICGCKTCNEMWDAELEKARQARVNEIVKQLSKEST